MKKANSLLVYIVAGEPSGDLLGARVMASLKKKYEGDIKFTGIGGPEMIEQGLKSLFPMSELAVMGVAEVLPRIINILSRIRQTASDIVKQRPDALLTIDSPDFCFRVAKRVRKFEADIPLIHFVAPSVWVWRPGRAKKVASFLDHLLTLLPFEPPYFEREGLSTTFVGHPVVESGADQGQGEKFRNTHDISSEAILLTVLPGSRRSEISRMAPVFKQTLVLLKKDFPDLVVAIPSVEHLIEMVSEVTQGWPVPVLIVTGKEQKFNAFSASNGALAASGTVALELALAGTPSVIAYRMNALTTWFARRLVTGKFVNLINITLDREAVPEFLLENCQPELLAASVAEIINNPAVQKNQKQAYQEALSLLGYGGESPGHRAAEAILKVIKDHKKV